MHAVRQPAVAGSFYPADPSVLETMVADLLQEARPAVDSGRPAPKAVVAPHAGYIYSGSTAALAYAEVERLRGVVRRVVVLGPCHRVAVRGVALPGARAFRTPLGDVGIVDVAALKLPHVVTSPDVHLLEHSLEVHVPFLQTVLGDFELAALAVGEASPQDVADVIEALWGGPETLVVVSTDLSHYLPYERAQRVDAETIEQILALDGPVEPRRACGARPLNGLIEVARARSLGFELLGCCNSGDTAGDRNRVVGYASFAIREGKQP